MLDSSSIASPDLTVYVDTNCFLQLRDIADLPWAEIAGGANHVEIAVARPVFQELDKFKVDRDQRRRDRARAAFVHIDRASAEEGLATELRVGPPRVSLRICGYGKMPWDDYETLDPGSADDKLVLTALTDRCEGRKLLMSFDRGPLINGRLHGLAVLASPAAWQLPDQKDEQTLEIERLKRELATLKSGRPQVAACFTQDDEKSGRITVRVLRPEPLSEQACQALRDRWLQKTRQAFTPTPPFPAVTVMWDRWISDDAKAAYETEKQAFPDRILAFFRDLHESIARVSHYALIGYRLENTTGNTARKLLVDLRAPEGVELQRKVADNLRRDLIKLPAVPARPEAGFVTAGRRAAVAPPALFGPRDPTGFYARGEAERGARSLSLICEEFRAQQVRESQLFVIAGGEALSGALQLDLSAENMNAPVNIQAGLVVTDQVVGWTDPDVLRRLPDWMSEILRP